MSFCPSCRQEFEPFVTRCYDCEVDLVAELKSADPSQPATIAVVIFDAPASEYVVQLLQGAGVQVRSEPGRDFGLRAGSTVVSFAAPYAQGVLTGLGGDPNLEEVEPPPSERVPYPIAGAYRAAPRKATDDTVTTAPLLDEPLPILLRRGEGVLPELLELVRRGAPKLRETALSAVAGFGLKGREALIAELPRLVREGRADALFGAAKLLRDANVDGNAWASLTAVAADDGAKSDARCLALHVLGRTGHLPFGTQILGLLESKDMHVREAADEALCNLFDDDLGFDPEADAAERQRVVDAWAKVLARRGVR